MSLDGTCVDPEQGLSPDRNPVLLRGGLGVLYIAIDDGIERTVYLNDDVPRVIDARDAFA